MSRVPTAPMNKKYRMDDGPEKKNLILWPGHSLALANSQLTRLRWKSVVHNMCKYVTVCLQHLTPPSMFVQKTPVRLG